MAKLSRREFQELRKKAIIQLKHIVLGYDIEPVIEDGCVKLCKGYEQIEVANVPQVPFPTKNGNLVVIKARIVVTGNGITCVRICPNDAEWLQSNINVLKEFAGMVANLKDNPGFDKEKIIEAYSALKNLQEYFEKLFPFTDS
jgi:hypothetical protein